MDVNTVEKDTDFLRKEATKVKLNKKEPNNEALRNFFKENCQALQYPDPIAHARHQSHSFSLLTRHSPAPSS